MFEVIWLNCTLFIFDQSSGCMKVCIFSFNLGKKILVLKYWVKKKHANTCLTQSRHAINRLLLKLFCSLQFAFETNEELAKSGSFWCYIFKIFLGPNKTLSWIHWRVKVLSRTLALLTIRCILCLLHNYFSVFYVYHFSLAFKFKGTRKCRLKFF